MYQYYANMNINKAEEHQAARALPPEEKFSYFCKFDELSGAMICPDVPLLALNKSCYQELSAIFGDDMQ